MSERTLDRAKRNKEDEFYTQLSDIEAEMRYYRDHFKDKVILCNCDDPYESNFFKFFAMNFNFLGLKKLITTCYADSPVAGGQLSLFDVESLEDETFHDTQPYKVEINEVRDENKDGAIDLFDVEHLLKNRKNVLTLLKGDGDFRSRECIELLKEADIVVTNPPFSLFREYVAQLIEYDKSFIIIGSKNAITYKETFKLLKEGKVWLGNNSGDMVFKVPNYYKPRKTRYWVDEFGQKWRSMGNVGWFTNLDFKERHQNITLYKNYSSNEYPTYENYNAINVNRVAEIPYDYDGEMGVPITFLDKFNPDQFKIIGLGIASSGLEIGVEPYKPKHRKYRREVQKRGVVDGDLYMMKGEEVVVPYARIIIKRIGESQ
ncbi:MAG: modification methylase [Clostridium sp.]|nr:modification methylase [Clostridium sp.]